MPAGEGRERGRTSQLDPSDKAIGRAQPPSSPTLSREGRGSQKLFRRSALLLIQRYWYLTSLESGPCKSRTRPSLTWTSASSPRYGPLPNRSTRSLFLMRCSPVSLGFLQIQQTPVPIGSSPPTNDSPVFRRGFQRAARHHGLSSRRNSGPLDETSRRVPSWRRPIESQVALADPT